MKKYFLAALLAFCLLTLPAFAATTNQQNTADALNALQLFKGTDKGYELDNQLQRSDGITLLVRLMGKENEAVNGKYANPFKDTAEWLAPYASYAYATGLTKGTSADTYGSTLQMNRTQFLTMVLRALGYKDSGENADFTWDNPFELAAKIGLASGGASEKFTRGEAVEIFWKAFGIKMKGTETQFVQTLIDQGVFTRAAFTSAETIQKNGKPVSGGTSGGSSSGGSSSGSSSSGSKTPAVTSTSYEEYCEMSGTEQDQFQKQFKTVDEFFSWLAKAMAASEENEYEVGDDGTIDLGDLG